MLERQDFDDTKIRQFEVARLGEQDVRGFDVSVYQPSLVDGRERARALSQEFLHGLKTLRLGLGEQRVEPFLEASAFDVLHAVPRPPVEQPRFEDAENMRVLNAAQVTEFSPEALSRLF